MQVLPIYRRLTINVFTKFLLRGLLNKLLLNRAMAIETDTSPNPDKIYTDVLSDARNACYKARDAFYTCLENESTKKASEVGSAGLLYPVECKQIRAEFAKSCRPSWVRHFDKLYCDKKKTPRLLDDNESRRGPLSFPHKAYTVNSTS